MVTEHVINTAVIKPLMEKLPNSYKVDLADVSRRLAVEVDGRGHQTERWRALDAKKDRALALLGWSVLRFSNQVVMEDTNSVVNAITSFTTSK